MSNTYETREAWLSAATKNFRYLFELVEAPLPEKIRLSVGFCSTGRRSKRVGECWASESSSDGHFEIFIRPEIVEPIEVLGVQAHELTHTAVGIKAGHGKLFKRTATAIGLEGKMRATTIGPKLKVALEEMAHDLGPYPHGGLTIRDGATTHKKQTTRLIKCECEECGYIVRVTRQWLAVGNPRCPMHDELIESV